MKNDFSTYAQGKLLLTGEYAVLDGAWALALPVRYGQSLRVEAGENAGLLDWAAQNHDDSIWFAGRFHLPELSSAGATDEPTASVLQQILLACRRQNPDFLKTDGGVKVLTHSDFPREWGLGTSSTLIAALARWAHVDPYLVLFETLGGSGYDLACAYASGPILYRLLAQKPEVLAVAFYPPFATQLYFVFLGKKQDSRAGIRRYREYSGSTPALVEALSNLTQKCLEAPGLAAFETLLRAHEMLLSEVLDLPRAKDLCFPDFWGEIKSLGAWGGDFVLATSAESPEATKAYFLEKGHAICIPYGEMVLR